MTDQKPVDALTAYEAAILRNCLAELYVTDADARRLCQDAGIDMTLVRWAQSARNTWHSIVYEAMRQDRLCLLLQTARREYPANATVRIFYAGRCTERPSGGNCTADLRSDPEPGDPCN